MCKSHLKSCIDSGLFMVFLLLHFFMGTCSITMQFILISVTTASTRTCCCLMVRFNLKPAVSYISALISPLRWSTAVQHHYQYVIQAVIWMADLKVSCGTLYFSEAQPCGRYMNAADSLLNPPSVITKCFYTMLSNLWLIKWSQLYWMTLLKSLNSQCPYWIHEWVIIQHQSLSNRVGHKHTLEKCNWIYKWKTNKRPR